MPTLALLALVLPVSLAAQTLAVAFPEEHRVLLGFWRGKRLRGIEPRLKPGGKFELATLELVEGTPLDRSTVVNLVKEAVALNAAVGDPTRRTY